jgi:hypothetical protein
MHRFERGRVRAAPRAAAALVFALTLTVATVPAGGGQATPTRATVKPAGQVTRTKGSVMVGRIPVTKTRNLRAGDIVTSFSNGEAKLHVTLKGTNCTVWPNTQLRVRPSKKVIYQVVNGNHGDLACGTWKLSRELASVSGPRGRFNVKLRDPVFSISVRRSRAVVKVSRGSVVLSGRSGLRGAVVVARKQQSVVPTGGDPRRVQPYRPTSRERAAFKQLESMLPQARDTTPPVTKFVKTPPSSTRNPSATFVFRANEAGASFSCSLDGETFRFCRSPATFVGLAPGPHRLSVRATDLEGNTGNPVSRTWTISGTGGVRDRFRQILARNATNVRLEADAAGRALVTYRSGGTLRRVLAWGAINAIPPTEGRDQVNFVLLYGGGPIRNVCRPYTGPSLAWLVVACTAPDGTHWALQSFQRTLPNYGEEPTPERAAWELWLSHWSGPVALLEIKTDWTKPDSEGVRHDHLYGRLTYRGQPVHGFRSTSSGRPLDPFGRNIYVDTFGSLYGPGWRRENGFLAQKPKGAFCYGFWKRLKGVPGDGDRYRATVVGPGVTPLVMWEGPSPGPYDPAKDEAANLEQAQLFAPGKPCPGTRP